ncbi:putative 60S ribosomal protein L26e [Monocercomonoides exilis]|uniref:putative 60S ribosomal protein L26e n=1 Tax=Monocercomonoides exilis TaxID=2049356 RepID=UPI003559F0BF|nr:putative 60S ribosomal protein L26e [Monocercomonoides exilis]|eukprot:MONOS_15746.1-p1 / transcript=MONOS_15746.1 / gene=MONOS_15746 / organism=Monocercomonoides_exilis_PA203 / gene_product=60S ribosomal protein L26e / transcript_product=60S ribosomal protein L26e / location=Mono_scaffold01339:1074-1661(-) / protein_length=144 / sequence_SO=supercontig / SO=protein_coding / is_pseudo=false
MKFSHNVSSSRRKSRKAHFAAPSHKKRVAMSVHLSKDLRTKYKIRSLPVRRDDEVRIMVGKKKNTVGKVINVRRKHNYIEVDRLTREKANGQQVHIPIHTSNVELKSFKMTADRKKLIARRAAVRARDADKGKITQTEVMKLD